MKVRRIPRTPPNRPASKTTLSRGDACPSAGAGSAAGLLLVQSSSANTNAAKSTSRVSSRRRFSVVVPGLKDVVQGSTCATSSRPRVNACTIFFCAADEPRKIRGLSMDSSLQQVGLPSPGYHGASTTPDAQDTERHRLAAGRHFIFCVRSYMSFTHRDRSAGTQVDPAEHSQKALVFF